MTKPGWSNVEIGMPSTTHWRKVAPSERPMRWAGNGRSREAQLYRSHRDELIRHVGGKPTTVQSILIHRLAWVQVHLARMDERSFRDGGLSDHATREYLAWTNTVSRMLQALGVENPSAKLLKAPELSLADHIASRRAPFSLCDSADSADSAGVAGPSLCRGIGRNWCSDISGGPRLSRQAARSMH
jgi:hypothetical protein